MRLLAWLAATMKSLSFAGAVKAVTLTSPQGIYTAIARRLKLCASFFLVDPEWG